LVERSDRASAVTFFSPDAFTAGVSVSLGDDAAQHARVLRLGAGASAELRDGHGSAARGIISRIAKRTVTIDVTEVWTLANFPPVHVLVPVADRDRMLVLAEKCTELAATSWRPVMWRRSRSVGPAGDGPAFQSRLKGRMVAALTQSGGGWLPEVHPSAPVTRAIAAAPQGTRLLCDARGERGLIDVDLQMPVSIAIGPEGGLDDKERDEMIEGGFTPVSLVGGTLRFETAGVAALAIVRARLGRGTVEEAD
jgi:16S rRNA (uracil1498-N3)-methyltransferase